MGKAVSNLAGWVYDVQALLIFLGTGVIMGPVRCGISEIDAGAKQPQPKHGDI